MDRSLPDRNVDEDSLADAYVEFILYCNPNYPLNTDVSQLRERFDAVPKSDGKSFEPWALWTQIKRYNAKEIETWTQLALDLGVEPPDRTKDQSVQKVQQYTVRLKRWMHAMHIDAFFEYLSGKQHVYFSSLPASDHAREARDGVAVEEDLALRALDPSLRPKRGRRRNSDIEAEEAEETASAFPMSALPMSAHPMHEHDPWAAAAQNYTSWQGSQSAVTPSVSHMRWRRPDLAGDALSSPHPSSAFPDSQFDGDYEPQSAVTSSSRKRRRHGPAVSSAWPSSSTTGSKPRGRPPASRNAPESPFTVLKAAESDHVDSIESGMPPPSARPAPPNPPPVRPARLSLTVPQHTGGPVRLATPPRVVLQGGSSEAESVSASQTSEPSLARRNDLVFTFEQLKRTLASDLLRAELAGRPQRLTGDEAKRLAGAILERMAVPQIESPDLRACIARLTTASWLGLGDQLNIPSGPAAGSTKKIRVTRFRMDEAGYEELVPSEEETTVEVRQVFDLRWQASQGACQGRFEMSGLTLKPTAPKEATNIHDVIIGKVLAEARSLGIASELGDLESRAQRSFDHYGMEVRRSLNAGDADENVDWKAKYRMMEFGTSVAHGEFDRFKAMMLQKVMDLFL